MNRLESVVRVTAEEAWGEACFAKAYAVHAVWRQLDKENVPSRSRVDPLQFGARLLPNLMLIEILGEGDDFRWRLCGERAAGLLGGRASGRTLSEIEATDEQASRLRGLMVQVASDATALFFRTRHVDQRGRRTIGSGVLLPVADPEVGDTGSAPVAYVLGAINFSPGSSAPSDRARDAARPRGGSVRG